MDKLKSFFAFFLLILFTINGVGQASPLDPKNQIAERKPLIKLRLPVDLLVSGGTVVTMNDKHEVIEDGAVAIVNNEIFLVGKRSEVLPQVLPASSTPTRTPRCHCFAAFLTISISTTG